MAKPAHRRAAVKNNVFLAGLMAMAPAPSIPLGANTTRMPSSRAALNGCNAKGTLNKLFRYTTSGAGVSAVPRNLARHQAKDSDDA